MNVDCAWEPMKILICQVNKDEPQKCPYYNGKYKCESRCERSKK